MNDKQHVSTQVFPIVAIAASAGGYEAFVRLIQELSPTTDMAYVFVQHLDPTHESKLIELLAKKSLRKIK